MKKFLFLMKLNDNSILLGVSFHELNKYAFAIVFFFFFYI